MTPGFSLRRIFNHRRYLLVQPDLLFDGDLPKDHLFAGRNVIAKRQAAKKESRRGR